jgi:hypothetical protein
MITLDDVKKWHVESGIGHIVCQIKDPGLYTACDTLHWGTGLESCQDERPKRICKKCREALKYLIIAHKESK